MSTIRLYLDADVWLGLAKTLRGHGFDVLHAIEVKQGELADPDQLAYAAEEKRTLLTHNAKDFVQLATDYFFGEHPHSGIILSPQIDKGELIRRTLNLLHALSDDQIANAVRYLADFAKASDT